jgi:hypothetical protein
MDDITIKTEYLGKGLIPDTPDARDYILETQFGAAPSIEWRPAPLGRDEPPDWNQRTSDSCVGCATRNVHWVLKRKDYSVRDIFSRIALAYGAQLRDGVAQICKPSGHQTRDECPDPSVPTPANMRVRSTKPDSAGSEDQDVLFGVNVSSAGWKDKTNPRPPKSGEATEGHAIAAFDYHLHNDKKCIIAKSSWCSGSHHVHHINEDYWATGHTFNGWCVIPKEEQYMTNSILCKHQVGTAPDGSPIWEFGFYDPATSPDALISDMRRRGINPPLHPEGHPEAGKLDWERIEPLLGGAVIPIK